MEEFKRLNWSWKRFQSDTELNKSYHLNLNESKKRNPGDVFHAHLHEIDHIHLTDMQQRLISGNEASDSNQISAPSTNLKDPRTHLLIPNYVCDYRDTDLNKKNIFLRQFIKESKVAPFQQMSCVEAIHRFSQPNANMCEMDRRNCEVYFATQAIRAEEKQRFLEFLKTFFQKNLTSRCRTVPPVIEYFVQETWKLSIIELLRTINDDYYKIAAAFQADGFGSDNLELVLKAEEHCGNTPEMCEKNEVKFLRKPAKQLVSDYESTRISNGDTFIEKKLEEWHEKYKPDFIMPISTIYDLLDAALSGKQDWMTKATIQERKSGCGNEIIFEKSLPPTYLSAMNKSNLGLKQLLRSTFTASQENSPENANDNITSTADDFSGEYKVVAFDELLTKLSKNEERRSFKNLSGNLFELSTNDGSLNATRILIQCEQDASRQIESGQNEFVYFSPKTEYQAEYGGEQMSLSELIKEWCFLYFQPKSSVYRVRCDVESSEIIDRKFLNLSDVNKELQVLYQIQSKTMISILWNILKIIDNFPNADYLLCHQKKTSHRVKVYCKQNNSEQKDSCLSLPTTYSNISYESSVFDEVTWQPIDDMVLTETHKRFKWLPCSFPHVKMLDDLKLRSKSQHVLRINPQDDRAWILKRNIKKQKLKQIQKVNSSGALKKKREKNARRRLKQKEVKEKTEGETKELLDVMKFFTSDSSPKEDAAAISVESDKKQRIGRKVTKESADSKVCGNQPPKSPTVTRTGRLVKPKRFHDI